jgi:hypothetical protein
MLKIIEETKMNLDDDLFARNRQIFTEKLMTMRDTLNVTVLAATQIKDVEFQKKKG